MLWRSNQLHMLCPPHLRGAVQLMPACECTELTMFQKATVKCTRLLQIQRTLDLEQLYPSLLSNAQDPDKEQAPCGASPGAVSTRCEVPTFKLVTLHASTPLSVAP